MKKWEVTYRNLNIVFGNNTFTSVLEGETAERALMRYGLENMYVVEMVAYKEA